jgi:hypothetical protein
MEGVYIQISNVYSLHKIVDIVNINSHCLWRSTTYTEQHFGLEPVGKVYVINKKWIRHFFGARTPCRFPVDRAMFERELGVLVGAGKTPKGKDFLLTKT